MIDRTFYMNMILGTVGMVLVGLGLVRYITLVYDAQAYGLGLFGFALINGHVFLSRKKTGNE